MKTRASSSRRPDARGFTLVEALITMSIAMLGMSLAVGTFLTSMRTMYRDGARLETNAALRYTIAHLSQETLDSSEFYLFPDYRKLDGSIDLVGDISPEQADPYGADLRHGDCLVLVTRVNVDDTSNVRQFRIYYRAVTSANTIGALRYYESQDWGTSGTSTSLTNLLNAVNLNASPAISGSRVVAARTRGRMKDGSTTECYPIFSAETSSPTANNEYVSVNVEVISGNATINMLSSSSFNYTISPRK
jgi:type II secretory pathway pseudopilin PulG